MKKMKQGAVIHVFRQTIALLFAAMLFNSCQFTEQQMITPIEAVPATSPVFVKINDISSFPQLFSKQNKWWAELCKLEAIKNLDNSILSLDSAYNSNQELKLFCQKKEIIVTFSPSSTQNIETMAIIPVALSGEQKKANSFFNRLSNTNNITISKRKFGRNKIYEAKSTEGNLLFLYTFSHKLLLISKTPRLIEEALLHIENPDRKTDSSLMPLLKTTNNQAQANLFVNHQLASEIFSSVLSEEMAIQTAKLSSYAAWTELDITIKEDKILLSGFTNGNAQSNFFVTLLQGQEPGISKIESVLPSNITYFSSYYLSDISAFFSGLSKYKSQDENAAPIISPMQQLFIEIFDGEMARATFAPDISPSKLGTLFAIKTKSGSYALGKLNQHFEKQGLYEKEFIVDNQTKYIFYRSPIVNLTNILFGNMFTETPTVWYTSYGNYLLFADSFSGLGKVIMSNILGETLLADVNYNKFQSSLSSKNNYYFYCNTSNFFDHAQLFFNENISSEIKTHDDFRKFTHFAWQTSSSGDMAYNNSSIVYDENITFKPQTVWQSRLAAPLAKRPYIIEDKNDTQNRLLVLADTLNNLYLMNNVGRIVWQMNTGAQILSEFSLIEIGKNKDIHLVFNTKEKMFILDKDGKAAKNFPVLFKITATNGVSVFDYENNRTYRFFFACEDQRIYAYDIEGKSVEGWNPPKTDHPINKAVQHIAVEGKDYIIVSDLMKDYIFDRKGNVRVPTNFVYRHSFLNEVYLEKRTKNNEPRLVTTDSEGNIHYTYFNGKHENKSFKKLDNNSFFVAANINADVEPEYIFAQGNQLFATNINGDSLFSIAFNGQSLLKPFIYTFSEKEKKIGVTDPQSNKVYLFNSDGSLHKGFPLEGNTNFNIGMTKGQTNRFNVYVGSPDGNLYNYLIE